MASESRPSDHPAELITVMLELERPSSEELAHFTRAEKSHLLREHMIQLRTRLVEWVHAQAWAKDVVRVGEPTVFNVLFIVSTPKAAAHLRHAPGVVKISLSPEAEQDLIQLPEEGGGDEREHR